MPAGSEAVSGPAPPPHRSAAAASGPPAAGSILSRLIPSPPLSCACAVCRARPCRAPRSGSPHCARITTLAASRSFTARAQLDALCGSRLDTLVDPPVRLDRWHLTRLDQGLRARLPRRPPARINRQLPVRLPRRLLTRLPRRPLARQARRRDRWGDSDRDRSGTRDPMAVAQHRPRAGDGHRDDTGVGIHRHGERAEPERQQSRHAVQRALGEEAQRVPTSHTIRQRRDAGDAALMIEPVNEFGAKRAQERGQGIRCLRARP